MARDPHRIRRMLALLKGYWNLQPELRLGQIVGNFSPSPDPYYVEDAVFERELAAALLDAGFVRGVDLPLTLSEDGS